MKKLFTFIICLLLINLARAASPLIAPANSKITHAKYDDTIRQAAVPGYYQNNIFKLRLDSIQKDVQLDYNEFVQTYIDTYSRHKDEMGRVLGLSNYYFPIYEKAFREAGIPEEIKYLSIVESKLDPTAVSRVGATGPWQFMAPTAKMYGLNMDSYVDDRRDPVQASYAAAAYLKDAYMMFGDWLLAIASYNCGKSSVERAVAKANSLNFWDVRQYLPTETRNYVPAFIGVAYVMNYAKKHDIIHQQPANFYLRTDTVVVNRHVSLSNIARAINVDLQQLAILNPAYKKQIVNGTASAPRRLVIPFTAHENYISLYSALNDDQPTVAAQYAPVVTYPASKETQVRRMPDSHIVKKGESLAYIADKYGVELQDLKDWNNLLSSKAIVGKKLWLNDTHQLVMQPTNAPKHDLKVVTYTVQTGDTLNVIANKFEGVSIENIKALNGLTQDRIQPGMTLKISRG
jgi:membrane-bound lytic murein transglycosylase D